MGYTSLRPHTMDSKLMIYPFISVTLNLVRQLAKQYEYIIHGPLTRYVKLWFAHAPGMPGTAFPTTDFKINR